LTKVVVFIHLAYIVLIAYCWNLIERALRVVFEAEASGGEVRQVVSPPSLSLPSPFPFPLSFQTNQWEGRSDPVTGKFPGFPPTNTTLRALNNRKNLSQ